MKSNGCSSGLPPACHKLQTTRMSISYLEDYLDTMESLPMELTRNFTMVIPLCD